MPVVKNKRKKKEPKIHFVEVPVLKCGFRTLG